MEFVPHYGDMTMSTQPKPWYTPEEYLAFERDSEIKHEYFEGEIFAMVGATEPHVLITDNLAFTLKGQLRDRPCRVYSSDMRVKVSATGLYTYPDVVVASGEREFDDDRRDTLLNPGLVIEVLSPSTEAYDRGKKFAHYRTIESLVEYVLVSQEEPHVERYARKPDGDWLLHEARRLEDSIDLPSIGCVLQLADVYDQVEFDAAEDSPAEA
jgi:Uma2 family endonuclease